jgi:hypothetical protein
MSEAYLSPDQIVARARRARETFASQSWVDRARIVNAIVCEEILALPPDQGAMVIDALWRVLTVLCRDPQGPERRKP